MRARESALALRAVQALQRQGRPISREFILSALRTCVNNNDSDCVEVLVGLMRENKQERCEEEYALRVAACQSWECVEGVAREMADAGVVPSPAAASALLQAAAAVVPGTTGAGTNLSVLLSCIYRLWCAACTWHSLQ
jgi:hypothetical protein